MADDAGDVSDDDPVIEEVGLDTVFVCTVY